MSRLQKITSVVTPFATILFLGGVSIAFGDVSNNIPPLTNPLGSNCSTLSCPVTTITNFLFTISIPLCAIMILVGGFQMMTAAGNPEKFSQGRKTLLYTVIGFTVILLAGSVAHLIQNFFGGS